MGQNVGYLPTDKIVVLLSGGMDSTTALTQAVREVGVKNVYPISFNYGQKHSNELTQAEFIWNEMRSGLKDYNYRKTTRQLEIVQLPKNLFRGAGSSLTDFDVDVKATTYREMIEEKGISETYVPYRNGVMLSLATSYALTVGAGYIFYGAHAEDSRNWAYPDCTPEFNGPLAAAIFIGSNQKVRLVTPFQWLSKGEIVQKALELSAPLHLTLSCYKGTRPACGVCPTCVERIEAFKFAGVQDPIEYSIEIDWEAALPISLAFPVES